MPRIDLVIPDSLSQKIDAFLNGSGFSSKAEFFRFAVIHYLDRDERMTAVRKTGLKPITHPLLEL